MPPRSIESYNVVARGRLLYDQSNRTNDAARNRERIFPLPSYRHIAKFRTKPRNNYLNKVKDISLVKNNEARVRRKTPAQCKITIGQYTRVLE